MNAVALVSAVLLVALAGPGLLAVWYAAYRRFMWWWKR